MIDFIDLFSGIGGFEEGLKRAGGFKRVWSCDYDPYANRVYYMRFKPERGTHWADDIRRVRADAIPEHDLLTAGFPCQSFSIVGPREGFESARGTLFYEIARIARAKKPPLLLLENVEGLLTHDRGRTFKVILEVLGEIGYWCEWQVLNTDWFGVPQHRERVFIVGHLAGSERGGREILPIRQIHRVSGAEDEGEPQGGEGLRSEVSPTIDARYGAIRSSGEPYIIDFYNQRIRRDGKAGALKGEGVSQTSQATVIMQINQRNEVVIKEDESFCLYANPPSDRIQALVKLGNIAKSGHDSKWGRVYDPAGVSATITGHGGGMGAKTGLYLDETFRPRRLTPIECERLQGFPDNWTQGPQMSDTQRWKCIGNAVTVDVIEFLGKRILSSFTNYSAVEEKKP